jgi:hypothetical protein
MRYRIIAMTVMTLPMASQAQQTGALLAPQRQSAALDGLTATASPHSTHHRDYRVAPSAYADRSAHTRALSEMNAINMRRPRVFRFRPVMALTFDAADMDGPARMSGIAPNLIGMKPRR